MNKHRNHHRAGLILCLLFGTALLTGCGANLTSRDNAPTAVYLLEGDSDTPARLNPAGPTLVIGAMRSAAGFDSADMVYTEHAHRLEAFARHRWADRPARMLEPLLIDAMTESGLFAGVTGPGSLARADLRLDTELLRLQQTFEAGSSQVELQMRASLVDIAQGRLLASREFRIIEPATEATPYGGVLAANKASRMLMAKLQAFARSTLSQRDSQPTAGN